MRNEQRRPEQNLRPSRRTGRSLLSSLRRFRGGSHWASVRSRLPWRMRMDTRRCSLPTTPGHCKRWQPSGHGLGWELPKLRWHLAGFAPKEAIRWQTLDIDVKAARTRRSGYGSSQIRWIKG